MSNFLYLVSADICNNIRVPKRIAQLARAISLHDRGRRFESYYVLLWSASGS